ncbi:MAG: NADH-quinone oxidoreductase subunit A [Alphaproteobacteria bacterium]|nr:NADH-quinone oxidoreductase subunit A [Alphaproteobacteria bacterium]
MPELPSPHLIPSVAPYLNNYLPIMIFFILAIGLSIALLVLNHLRSTRNPDPEKISPYECGFNAFEDTRHRFDVRFYLIAILFIIFDLEIAFLFPWAITLSKIGLFGFCSMISFLSILTIGFIYEWKKGALEWE